MTSIALVGCGKRKVETGSNPVMACDLYIGSLFKASYAYACLKHDRVFILSAFYGAILPDHRVYSYERELPRAPNERRDWGLRCASMLRDFGVSKGDDVHIYAGQRYAQAIATTLTGINIHLPLEGMTMGRRLQWLTQMRELEEMSIAPFIQHDDLERDLLAAGWTKTTSAFNDRWWPPNHDGTALPKDIMTAWFTMRREGK